MRTYPVSNPLILTGPTGSGKTELAIAIAERYGCEIVAMDSMTLYRGMEIGTAKPTAEQRGRVPHHLLDVLDPCESASVAWWLERATACARDIAARGRRVLFVGGTALYLKALLFGLFDGPPADASLRLRLEQEAAHVGRAALHARLMSVDPTAASRIHHNDLRRVIRALEVWELTRRPLSDWQQQWPRIAATDQWPLASEREPLVTAYWLDLPRAELYTRIDARVLHMIDAGLVDEVRALRRLPRAISREAAQALGYKEMFDHLDGLTSLEEAVRRIQMRSRNFAKRQLTWFRHLPGLRPLTRELTFTAAGLTMGE